MLKSWRLYSLLLVLTGTFALLASGQQVNLRNNFQSRYILPSKDTLLLDSLSMVPGSLIIEGLDSTQYYHDALNSRLFFLDPASIKDSVKISYRRFPISFHQPYFHKDASLIEKNVILGNSKGFQYNANTGSGQFIDFNTLDYSGTYGRSLSVGNNQDVILNSQFNLQLNGYLLDSIKVEAAITDNNIPFQPEGNTQRLQEFDRIYITFSKRTHKLTLGDYNLERPDAYFLNFNKRVQGIQYQGGFWQDKKVKNKVSFSGSMAKGQFTRNIFQGIEGNQGPYKLQGENGEQFFIVLAGSERVFIDGELLQRGEDQDYIINYNLGEVTFMPRRLITKDKRIQIDFEYQARNYLNTLIQFNDEVNIGDKWAFRFNLYANQDAKNETFNQSLSDDQKRFLAGIGDNIDQAFYSTERLDTFAPNKILYKKTDTIVAGILYQGIYKYSTNPDSAIYNLGFSNVGQGNGNYIISDLNTNGRSYQWVAPVNGISQGSFEPKVLLITPKKLQVLTAAGRYKIDSLKQIDFEWAGSNYSPNTFSRRNNNEHWGNALRFSYNEARIIKRDTAHKVRTKWLNNLNYEFVDNRFEAVAPYRNVEFNRDWNILGVTQRQNEHLLDINTGLLTEKVGNLKYKFTYYSRNKDYEGSRHLVEGAWTKGLINAGTYSSALFSRSATENSIFLRPQFFIETHTSKKKSALLGFKFEKEYNALRSNTDDQLTLLAYDFDVSKLYFRTTGNKNLALDLAYNYRRDFAINGADFALGNSGHTFDAQVNVTRWKNHSIAMNGSYRILDVHYDPTGTLEKEHTLVGRINYNGNIKNGFFTPTLLYDFGTGQEQKRQFTFVEVPAGQGTHMWIDYNKDSVQQANEFEIAIYPDQKRFIKVITPTNEYVKVNFANLNLSFQLMPESIWRNKKEARKKWQTFVSRFSDQFNLQVNNRVLNTEGLRVFNPLVTNFTDTAVVSTTATLINTFYFNRSSTKWGIDYTTNINRGQALLTYGLETQTLTRHNEKVRWILNKNLTLTTTALQGTRSFRSPIPDGRTYEINYQGIEPSLVFIYGSKFRITPTYRYESRKNGSLYGGEEALVHNLALEARWSALTVGNLLARTSYSKIAYNGLANTPLSFVMLETLSKGNNWLWYLNWTTRLNKTIEFSIEYDGRKPGNQPVIHTGSMSLRAVL